MKLIHVLWSGRDRRPNRLLQERLSHYSLYGHRDVQGTVVRPPVKERPR